MNFETYYLIIFYETAAAYLVGKEPEDRETDAAFWLPKSKVELGQSVQKGGIEWGFFEIPDWLAEARELISPQGDDVDLFE